MENKKVMVLNTPIDALTLAETVTSIDNAIRANKHLHHIAVNAAKIVAMRKNNELRESVLSADIVSADGLPIVWASRLFRKPLPERVAGIDLMQRIVELAHEKNYKIYFLGAKEEVVSNIVHLYSKKYKPEIIAGYRNGYFTDDEEQNIAIAIAESGANILFVAMTSPKKEIFLYKHKEVLKKVNFIMGVGGSFDVIAGKVKRAPKWMQNIGLEWFYRFMQEPRRMWKRYLITNSLFIYYVIRDIFSSNHKNV